MRNSKVHIEWQSFEALCQVKEDHSAKDCLKERTTFYDLGSKETYFFATSQHQLPFSGLLNNLKEKLSGQYLLVEIQTHLLPFFYVVIKQSWLEEQLHVEEAKIRSAINTVLVEWQKTGTKAAMRHFLFQKNFNQSNHQLILCQTYFFELLYLFLNSLELELRGDMVVKFRDAEIKKIMEVEAQIIQNLSVSSPTIEQMSAMAGMNISKFKILFKEVFGQSPHQYILEKKLEYAKVLLQSGKYTLTQIAYKLGYNHTSGFTRIYKKKFHE